MPNYEYKCTSDGSTFELWQEVGASAPTCPTCGAPTKKVFHPTRTIFKGAGFYVTDLRSEQNKSSDKSAAKTETASEAGAETPSEAPAKETPAVAPAPAAPASD